MSGRQPALSQPKQAMQTQLLQLSVKPGSLGKLSSTLHCQHHKALAASNTSYQLY